ncbi:hypothetical protein [Streptomyces sp. NPDC051132]|uniref:hypothetical protein n=1 Tax=unclassified Streptomyces TaxID=2593676 RepID=UPI0034161447
MTFSPRTWVVGEVVSATVMNQEIRDQFNSMFAAWTSYTPAWTASTTNPVLSNGTMVGRYMKWGRTVLCEINLTMGSLTTFGSGNYAFGLPVQAANAGTNVIGHAQLLGTDRWMGQVVISASGTTCAAFFPTTGNPKASFLTQVLPESHAAGDQVRLTFVYESAT